MSVYPLPQIPPNEEVALVERQAAPELMQELRERGLRVARAEHVQRQLSHVPCGAVRR